MAIFKDGVTVDETTGKVLAVGDKTAQFNPQVDATTNTSAVTPNLSLADAQAQASNILGANSGLVSPMSLTDIRAQEAEQKRVAQQGAEAQYNPQIAREEKMGATTLSTAEGALGQRQGFNLSSAESAYIASVQSDVAQRIKEVEDQKAAAISTGNFNATTWADTQLQKLQEYNNNLLLKKADLAMNLISQNQAQQQIDLSKTQNDATQKLQAEQLALQSYETAIKTPVGQKFTVNGITYTGMKDAAGIDPSNIVVSTDDKGYETGINKLTGEVLWKSDTPTGKSKTAAASVTVNVPSYGSSVNKVVGADGKIVGYVRFDSKSNQVIKQDINGNTITEFPAGSVIGEPTKDDGGWGI